MDRRGGARNRADRESHCIATPQVANLIEATEHAIAIGLPFTRMITIHWESAGVPLCCIAGATGHFLDLLSKTLARNGSRTAWIWVHEGGEKKGIHCHILAHVPAQICPLIAKLQLKWLRHITGLPYKRNVIRNRPIGRRVGVELGNPAFHLANVQACLGYLLKGACDEAVETFGLEFREHGGLVIGKRCATSQNIGKKARRLK